MNALETNVMEAPETAADNVIHLPLGLLGLEQIKKYMLLASPEEAPFAWLQVMDDPNLAFLVVPVFDVVPGYQPDISHEDVEFLDLNGPEDALVLGIVTMRGNGRATVNLKGPVVINRHTRVAKQVVITNAAEYSLQHPLPVAE
jgi:flagellar assembly factor FliW